MVEVETGYAFEGRGARRIRSIAGTYSSLDVRVPKRMASDNGSQRDIGAGIAVGLGLGVAIGAPMDELATGVALGLVLGVGIGAGWSRITE